MAQVVGRIVAAGLGLIGAFATACSSPNDSEGSKTNVPSAELCAAQYDALEKACPTGNPRDLSIEHCKEDQKFYEGEGCQEEYDAWLACTASSGYECNDDTGCEASQGGYFACQSRFVQRTGCVRLGGQDDARCNDAAKPYAISCLTAAPAACTPLVAEGAGVWCCPLL